MTIALASAQYESRQPQSHVGDPSEKSPIDERDLRAPLPLLDDLGHAHDAFDLVVTVETKQRFDAVRDDGMRDDEQDPCTHGRY